MNYFQKGFQIRDAIFNRISEVISNVKEDTSDCLEQEESLSNQVGISQQDAATLLYWSIEFGASPPMEDIIEKIMYKYLRWGENDVSGVNSMPQIVLYSNAQGKHFYEAASLPEAERFKNFLLARPDEWNVKIVANTGE
jgi:hypothetical protein